MRIIGLASGHSDGLDATETEHDHRETCQNADPAVRCQAAVLEKIVQARGCFARNAHAEDQDRDAAEDHRDHGADLDDRHPELHLTEHLDVPGVDARDDQHDCRRPDPPRRVREPQPHIYGHRGHVRDRDDEHTEHVRPAGREPQIASKVPGRVVRERARNRVADCHLTQGTHHDEHRSASHDVGEQNDGSCGLDRVRGPIEQPGSDRRTERHELDVAAGQAFGEGSLFTLLPGLR